jgi:hypothetical protein
MIWVIGTINNHHKIKGRIVDDCGGHTQSECNSKKLFRWSIDEQCFHPTIQNWRGIKLTEYERSLIESWLIVNGHKKQVIGECEC